MPALNYATSVLFCIGATAATYLAMHFFVGPRLPIQAVDVPQLQGLSVDQARALCDPRGLLLVVDGERLPEVPTRAAPGTLFEQHPLAGSRLHRGDRVHAAVAVALPAPRVPALLGQTLDSARGRLRDAGLSPGAVTEEVSTTVAAGLVIGTEPAAGAEAAREQAVALRVSKGAEQVQVPNLRGQGLRGALKLLEAAGLVMGERHRGSDDNADEGVVVRQLPVAGGTLAKGQKVDLWINE